MFQAILENLASGSFPKEDAFEISKRPSYAAPARRGQACCSQPLTLNSVPNTTTKTNTKFVHQVHDLRGQTRTLKKVLGAWFHTATYGSYHTELAGLLLAASRRRTVTLLLFYRRALALTLLQEVTQTRCASLACVSTFTPHCLTCASTCARSSQSTKYSFLRGGWTCRGGVVGGVGNKGILLKPTIVHNPPTRKSGSAQ